MTTISPHAAPRLLLPFLARFYDLAIPLSWPIIRVAAGLDLAIHGWEKMVRLPPIVSSLIATGSAAQLGPQFDPVHNIVLAFFEFVGGIAIALGLFTRFFAAALAIELLIALLVVHLQAGFAVGKGGYEYVLLLGIVLFAIAIRGGGPYSVDRLIGKEL